MSLNLTDDCKGVDFLCLDAVACLLIAQKNMQKLEIAWAKSRQIWHCGTYSCSLWFKCYCTENSFGILDWFLNNFKRIYHMGNLSLFKWRKPKNWCKPGCCPPLASTQNISNRLSLISVKHSSLVAERPKLFQRQVWGPASVFGMYCKLGFDSWFYYGLKTEQ